MKNIRQPPIIHHCNQTEYIQRGASLVQMAADACAAMYLPDRMKKLLTFYADCPDGFFPALKTVHDATGMDRKDIYKARKELVDLGFILYTPEEIRIDWQRVATMAMLPPEAGESADSIQSRYSVGNDGGKLDNLQNSPDS